VIEIERNVTEVNEDVSDRKGRYYMYMSIYTISISRFQTSKLVLFWKK